MNNNIIFNNLSWTVGCHLSFKNDLFTTLKSCISFGLYTVQFFLGNPKSFSRKIISKQDLLKTKKLLEHYPTKVFTHAPYLYNLCGSVKSLAWEKDENINSKLDYILSQLTTELDTLSNINGKVVIHPGSFPNHEIGLKCIIKSINKIKFKTGSKLLLENSAGQGSSLATTLSEIKTIIQGVNQPEHIGVCIDTQHLFAYGEYDIRTTKEVKRFLNEFEVEIGLNKLELIHLNDSEVSFGSKRDRHSLISRGYIWRDDISSLIYLLNRCTKMDIPFILETHPSDMFKIYEIYENYL